MLQKAPLILKFREAPVQVDASLLNIDRLECEESLYDFLLRAWDKIDPSVLIGGWPIEAIAKHLEAVVDGEIKRLVINIPPRMGKSTITSVCFPAWTWSQTYESPTSGPGVQFLHASYAKDLALRDSVKCRRLIDSQWYQARWGERFRITSDQNTKTRFDNTRGGSRLSTSVGSQLTGEGGNIIVVDDPNAAQEAFSEATIESTIEWWDNALSTRLNDQKNGAFVVIQQRLSEQDLTGHILEKDIGEWCHLMLPMKYEQNRSFQTVIGWEDPRSEEGELLWPDRMGEREVRILEKQLGPWGTAGQLQQRPEPKGGGILKRDWWQLWDRENFPPIEYIIASLDTAYTTKTENDYSALTVWGIFTEAEGQKTMATRVFGRDEYAEMVEERRYKEEHPKTIMMHAWQERLEFHDLMQKVAETMKEYKVDKLLIENKSAGPSLIQEIRRVYSHLPFVVEEVDVNRHANISMDKVSRAHAVVPLFAGGLVYAPERSWSDMVITQCSVFPRAKNDDLVDTVTMALQYMRRTGLILRGEEWTATIEEDMLFTGNRNNESLYPA